MVVEKLGPVEPLKNLQNTQKTTQAKRLEASDSISLSPEAQKLSEVYLAMETAKAAPDVREEKVAEVAKKLNDPNYIDSILEKTANRILDSFGL